MRSSNRNTLSTAIIALLIVAVTLFNLTLNIFDFSIIDKEDDVIIMKVFIIVAGTALVVAITLILFFYSHKTDRTVESHLCDHRLSPGRTKMSRQAGKARETRSTCAAIGRLMRECTLLDRMSGKYEGVPDPYRPQFRDDLEALHCNAVGSASELRRMLGNVEYLDDRTCDNISAAIGLLKNKPPVDGNETVDTGRYREILDILCSVQDRLERRLDLASEQPDMEPGCLALCLDRDTYPPGAAIRATVKADGQFPGREVTVVILDEGFGTPAKRTVAASAPKPGRRATLVMSVIPKKCLNVGQEYMARAECGGQADEAAFAVDNIAPTVQADGYTCMMGECIDITVVDPAAGAGVAGKGPAVATKEPRLVAESPRGRIDSCRLEEAGDSPGIFRCRIRCVGAHTGTAAPGSGCDVAGAGGKEDAAIACGPNQLVRIMYTRGNEEARTAVLVEGLGAPVPAAAGGPSPESDGSGAPARQAADGGGGSGNGTGPEPRDRDGDHASRLQGDPREDGRGR